MSRIDELIRLNCPAGVPFEPLGEHGEFVRGNGLRKSDLAETGCPAIHYGQIHTVYGTWTAQTKSFTDSRVALRLRRARSGDLVIATTSEDDLGVGKATAWLGEGEVAISGDAYVYRHGFDPRYVAYLFQTRDFQDQKQRSITGTKVRRISGDALAKIRVPVPPLEVQREIVRVLDTFTALEAELEAELEARISQRAAIATNFAVVSRDKLHTGAEPDRVTLGSLARESVEPVKVSADDEYVSLGVKWSGGGVLVRDPRAGREIKAATLYRARPGQLVYNRMFVVEGSFALVPPECEDAVVSGEFPLFDLDSRRVESEWLLQYLCDPFTLSRIEGEVTGTERGTMKSRRRWKQEQFAAFEIDLPSLDRQRFETSVLRSCDALISSLEAEIAARRQQYEYYRDKLLTFEEAPA